MDELVCPTLQTDFVDLEHLEMVWKRTQWAPFYLRPKNPRLDCSKHFFCSFYCPYNILHDQHRKVFICANQLLNYPNEKKKKLNGALQKRNELIRRAESFIFEEFRKQKRT